MRESNTISSYKLGNQSFFCLKRKGTYIKENNNIVCEKGNQNNLYYDRYDYTNTISELKNKQINISCNEISNLLSCPKMGK